MEDRNLKLRKMCKKTGMGQDELADKLRLADVSTLKGYIYRNKSIPNWVFKEVERILKGLPTKDMSENCWKCKKPFRPEYEHNVICPSCRKKTEWVEADYGFESDDL